MGPTRMVNNSLQQHYLNIQALTPVASQDNLPATTLPATTPASPPISIALYLFISLLIFGMIALLFSKVRRLNQMIAVLVLAIITSAIPLGLNLTKQKVNLSSQAGPQLTPQAIVVDQVNPNSFRLSWHTDQPQIGIVKLSSSPDMNTMPRIITEPVSIETFSHSLTLSELEPQTSYYLEILSGSTWYNHQGQPLEITTPP